MLNEWIDFFLDNENKSSGFIIPLGESDHLIHHSFDKLESLHLIVCIWLVNSKNNMLCPHRNLSVMVIGSWYL